MPMLRCQPSLLTAGDFRLAVTPILPALTRYAHRLAKSAADTDDLVQDTLLKAWAARNSFRPGSNLKAWLMRIARNTFLSGLRRTRRQILWEPEEIARALVSVSEQESAVMLDDLAAAVQRLPLAQRHAFELVVNEGLSYEEAAAHLGVELGTMKSQVSRARATLVQIMDTPPELALGDAVAGSEASLARSPARQNIYARWKASGSRLIGAPEQLLTA